MKRDAFFSSGSLALLASLAVALVATATATADTVSCAYFPGGGALQLPPIVSAQATPTPTGGAANMGRLGGGADIIASADNGSVDCGRGTVFNTGLIALGDASPQGQGDLRLFYIPVGASPWFAPGYPDEPGSSDEIEFGVAFGPGKDVLGLDAIAGHGPGGASTIRLGTDGIHDYINLNAAETTGIDQDVSMLGVDQVYFGADASQPNNDDIRGIGGAGTGAVPFPIRLVAYLGAGDDVAVGSTVGDFLNGDDGSDNMVGKDGPDVLGGGDDADQLFGGEAVDTIDGNDGGDVVYGGDAGDQIHGGPGGDDLKGGTGADDLFGGSGFDHCAGGPGKDSFIGCEVVSP